MKFTIHTLVAASALAFLSACGGDDSSSQPGSTALAITSTNVSDVARASINGVMAVALGESALGAGGATLPATVTGRSHALGTPLARVLHAAMAQRKGIASVGAHPSSATTACADGGTLTTSFDDKDGNSVVSTGDVITIAFAQCHETVASTVDGAVTILVSSTPTASQFAASVQFQALAVVDAGASSSINGQVSVAETDTDTRSDSTITVGAQGLTATLVSSTYTDTLAFDAGMVVTTGSDHSIDDVSITMAGSFASRTLGGRVTVATPTPLFEGAADAFPSSGVLRITGISGSTLVVTALNSSQAQLQLDANGDGTFESTSTVAWTSLVP